MLGLLADNTIELGTSDDGTIKIELIHGVTIEFVVLVDGPFRLAIFDHGQIEFAVLGGDAIR